MSGKQREALEKCDVLLKRITKSAWFIESRMGLTKETMDVGNAITAALAEPPCNCEVGTAEEQTDRFNNYCDRFLSNHGCSNCPLNNREVNIVTCVCKWSQMPHESEVKE